MGDDALKASQAPGGAHHALARMVGSWHGTARVWFERDELVDESPVRGTIRAALGGRFVIHEYHGAFGGQPIDGLAVIGRHLDAERHEIAWIDSFHTGSSILWSTGAGADGRLDVLGRYGGHDGSPSWGWRSTIEQPDDDTLILTAWNISPEGEEVKATEIVYRRD